MLLEIYFYYLQNSKIYFNLSKGHPEENQHEYFVLLCLKVALVKAEIRSEHL